MSGKSNIIILLIFLCTYLSQAQHISTRLLDSQGVEIIRATVFLQDQNNKTLAYTSSNNEGLVEFKNVTNHPTASQLTIQKVGIEKTTISLDATKNNYGLNNPLYLLSSAEVLNEITIKATSPITVKKDTVVYNAKQFSKGDERVIEDLLKNLPGLEISTDGKISVNNQEVEKVMVDGTDLFDRGYRVLTKNMPVSPVEEVELLQNYSENKHLTNLNPAKKLALNLKLSEEAKRVWFGNVEVGAGVRDKEVHSARSNIMNFGKKTKFYSILQSNNISYDATGDLSSFLNSNKGEITTPTALSNPINIDNISLSLRNHRYKDNNNQFASINTAVTLSPKVEVKISGLFNKETLLGKRAMDQTLYTPDHSYHNIEMMNNKNRSNFSFLKGDMVYDINKTSTLKYDLKGNISNTKINSAVRYNDIPNNQALDNENKRVEQNLEYTTKLSDKQALVLSYKNIYEQNTQDYINTPNIYIQDATAPFSQLVQNKMNYHTVQASYKGMMKGNHLLHLTLGNTNTNTHLYSLNNLADDDTYTNKNNSTLKVNELYAKALTKMTWGTWSMGTSISASLFDNKLKSITTDNSLQKLVISPHFSIEKRINDKNKIDIYYKYGYTNINAAKTYDGYIQTSYRSFLRGTTNLDPFTNNAVGLTYTLGNYHDRSFSTVTISYNKYNDFYTQNNYIYPNHTKSNISTIKNNESYFILASTEYYFQKLKHNLKLNLNANQADFYNTLNDSETRRVRSTSLTYGIELKSNLRSRFNYAVNTNWFTTYMNIISTERFIDTETKLTAKYKLKDVFYLNLISELYSFDKVAPSRKYYTFLDFNIAYIPSKSKWNARLELTNLFNTKTYANYALTDYSNTSTTYKLLGRQLLLSVNYSF
ncbi:hypothetical protein [Myroides odoratimimus]|uniref:hypothetical protein n=1 Tax=Myroides odoratimimus TaxID=76832 RepID=UPI002575229C|nr:hypothetical protein [Myroides odoratimimus]MDM1529777.1 TonB-dependent receptor [Myroides odoratimimus]